LLPSTHQTPNESLDWTIVTDGLHELIAELTPREQQVITMRYGLNNNTPLSLGACGERLGISSERVRQIESKVMKCLTALAKNCQDIRECLYILN